MSTEMDDLTEAIAARAAFELIPHGLRNDLDLSADFLARAGLARPLHISFGNGGPKLNASALFGAVGNLHTGAKRQNVIDSDGCSWTVTLSKDEQGASLKRQKSTVTFTLAYALSMNVAVRMEGFARDAAAAQLLTSEVELWRSRFVANKLNHEELLEWQRSLDAAPDRFFDRVRAVFGRPSIAPAALVPEDPATFERLVGPVGESTNVIEFLKGPASQRLSQLYPQPTAETLEWGLLLAAHAEAARVIDAVAPGQRAVLPLQDPFSRLGYIEYLAIQERPDRAEILALARGLQSDAADFSDACDVASALFIHVEAELLRRGQLEDKPPFWRRLAALALTALLYRAMPESLRKDMEFRRYLDGNFRLQFAVATLLDLRREPRWWPSYATGAQFRDELYGRLISALIVLQLAEPSDAVLEEVEAIKLLLGDRLIMAGLPGPCEGNVTPKQALPPEARAGIHEGLKRDPPDIDSLHRVFLQSLIFEPDRDLALDAGDALGRLVKRGHDPTAIASVSELLPHLAGVAALNRDPELADQVRTLCRLARRHEPRQIDPEAEFEACVIAAAARQDFDSYASALADWLEEIAREAPKAESGFHLARCIDLMTYRLPQLWPVMARARAAAELLARRDAH